ncbi:hypothetical protein SETIT_9G013100v2 [Setaria italica]|uniref:Uncharacterized protein n=1 Tax=Setaria italica TaxID=4555 RepID=A0A368SC21_SETIT|nr:hypothetical protein SETIT_9G013100v2 [Setaria italica]
MGVSRLDLFYYPTTPRKAEQKKLDLRDMESWKVDCFGLSENKIICTDNCGLRPRPGLREQPGAVPRRARRRLARLRLRHGQRHTYCLDTATGEWSCCSGDWTMPFYGKAEYVPELDVWFGISDQDFLPCASDLSCALDGEKPELRGVWRNLFPPPEWESFRSTQIVSMGRKPCIGLLGCDSVSLAS